MESHRPPWTLGAAFLGLILCGITVLGASRQASHGSDLPLEFPGRQDFANSRSAQRFGWSISAGEADPAAWAQLRGVGPVLSGRIAHHAALGLLRSPEDLLRVRGIGIKMASRLEPWVLWSAEGPPSPVCCVRQEGSD